MVAHWLRTGTLGAALIVLGAGCLGARGSRGTLTVGPEGADRPVSELPARDTAHLCLVTAYEFEKNNRVPEAIALYEKARAAEPAKDKMICRRLAVLYDQTGNFDRADEEYDKALALQPKDADLLNDIGYSHYARGNWVEAENYLSEAVAANPQHKRAWINLGLAIAQQERYPESMKAFRRAVPEPEALCNLAFVLGAQGKKEESLDTYRKARELAPSLQLAQAAVQRYTTPDTISGAPPAPRAAARGEPRPAAPGSPYGAVKAMPTSRPVKSGQEPEARSPAPAGEPAPLVIDPDFDSLPSRPMSEPPTP